MEFKEKIVTLFFNLNDWKDIVQLCDIYYAHNKIGSSPIELKHISFFLFTRTKKYRSYEIAKKREGHTRTIHAPMNKLKLVQKVLNYCLQECFRAKYSVHGFVKERSIVSNASKHVGRKFVYNIDLKDFFPSIHFGRVKGVFKGHPFKFSEEMASYLATLCTHENILPQGAPTSPVISNLICRNLDFKLFKFAHSQRAMYTRFADDISFSSQKDIFDDLFEQNLSNIIVGEGFQINEDKVWKRDQNNRQTVTGLVVNKKVNVTRQFKKDLRYLIKIFHRDKGSGSAQLWLEKYYRKKHRYGGNTPKIERIIEGKLSFLKMVVGKNAKSFRTLELKYHNAINGTSLTEKELSKIKADLSEIISELMLDPDSKKTAHLLVAMKILLVNNGTLLSLESEFKNAEKIFNKKRENTRNRFFTKNNIEHQKNPIDGIYPILNETIKPKSTDRYEDLQKPQYLVYFLQLFRGTEHPFGQFLHGTDTAIKDIFRLSNLEFKKIGKSESRFPDFLPVEIHGSVKAFLNIIEAKYIDSDISSLEFIRNEKALVEGFKKTYRFGPDPGEMKLSEVIRYQFIKDPSLWKKIWYLDLQKDLDEIFKNILTSTKNIEKAIEYIFESCGQYSNIGAVKVIATPWNNKVVLRIINLGIHLKNRTAHEFLNELGGIKQISNLLEGYCDFNIRAIFANNSIRVPLLSSNTNKEPSVSENYTPEGFTFELIFYKPIRILLIDDGDNGKRINKLKAILKNKPLYQQIISYTSGKKSDYNTNNFNVVLIHMSHPEYDDIRQKLVKNQTPYISFSGEASFDKRADGNLIISDYQLYNKLEEYLKQISENFKYEFQVFNPNKTILTTSNSNSDNSNHSIDMRALIKNLRKKYPNIAELPTIEIDQLKSMIGLNKTENFPQVNTYRQLTNYLNRMLK